MAYLIAGVVTLASAYFSRRALRTSGQAFNDLVHRSQREADLAPLRDAFAEFSRRHPEVLQQLENRGNAYAEAWSELGEHLRGGGEPRSLQRMQTELDAHVPKILDLPLLKRRHRVRKDLEARIAEWKEHRNLEPLMEWVAENRNKDLLKTANGNRWHGQLEQLRLEFAHAHWAENRSLVPLDSWLASESLPAEMRTKLASPAWVKRYEELKEKERLSARNLVAEVNGFTGRISETLGPEVLGPLVSLGDVARQPGNFQRTRDGSTSWVAPDGIVQESKTVCEHWFSQLSTRASQAAGRYTLRGIGRRLVWPAVPVATGLSVGGYYSAEGLRYYLMPSPKKPDLPQPPDLLDPQAN